MRNCLIFGIAALGLLGGCAPKPDQDSRQSVPVETNQKYVEPAGKLKLSEPMEAAIREARAELPTFWKAWADGSWGSGDYIVSAQFMSEDGTRGEFLWISVQARGEGEVTGLMEGNPDVRKDIKNGQVVTVKESDVVDWMYVPADGDHRGGYTLKALGEPVE